MAQTILIADDDRDHLMMMAFTLRKAGYNIISAFDAKHALQLAVEKVPDLLLLDIHLGDEAGFTIQQKLAELEGGPRTPVIYLTGDTSASTRVMTEALGAQAVLHKPVEWDTVLATIASTLERHGMANMKPALECAEAYIG